MKIDINKDLEKAFPDDLWKGFTLKQIITISVRLIMAAGTISGHNNACHFEIVSHTKEQAHQLKELLCGFDTDAQKVERKGHYVV